MNTKNNKRRKATRERIETAFINELQTKDISKISVSDICKTTGFNRSTFYANYEDVYFLANEIRIKLEHQVKDIYEFDIANNFKEDTFLRLFYHIKNNQPIYKTYFKLGYDTNHQLDLSVFSEANRYIFKTDMSYHLEFFKAGLNSMIKIWLQNGCDKTPEEMNEILKEEYSGRRVK